MKRNYLSLLHLTVGLLALLFFIWTGNYLSATYPDKQSMDMGFRVMLRSRHIFLLLVSLAEIGLGTYIQPARRPVMRGVQWVATAALLTAHALFIWAFFYEVALVHVPKTPVLHWATYLAVTSLLLHALTRFER